MTMQQVSETSGLEGGDIISVRISGDTDTHYTATWIIHREGESETLEVSGRVPESHEFRGDGLEAVVTQTSRVGHLILEVSKGGNISRSSTGGQGSEMRINVR
ncbi:hypothetical protein [Billgrantia endophytica]|uniref:Uncharacterized protein n=1 Tax=Billgrantia endophytica TaxID=2033802 RepID=A0A2N7U2N7_9GAMM|nr:hypothetical protein [Halomonas endophytica]PMR74705.1 hypothetical protein C1H69_12685 [Halomonas endophytica]